MSANAKIICDSISEYGDRLTTIEVTCHRFVLAELNTHRQFSRNSASSRARPITKTLAEILEHPAFPIEWTSEKPGMQGGHELQGQDLLDANELWEQCLEAVTTLVQSYVDTHDQAHRLHKSLLNRLIEPFMYHTVIISSTEWDNFFTQRCSPLAQPEIRVPAEMMYECYKNSSPKTVKLGDWHLPYLDEEDLDQCRVNDVNPRAVSAARCARVSYLTHDGKRDVNLDLQLFEKLVSADPPHWSPMEHVARPFPAGSSGNFCGWMQLRELLSS